MYHTLLRMQRMYNNCQVDANVNECDVDELIAASVKTQVLFKLLHQLK